MEDLNKTESLFNKISKLTAGIVFVSFVIGLSFFHGWQRGLGLLSGNFGSHELISFLGFLATFSLIPELLYSLLSSFLDWRVWIAIIVILALIASAIKLTQKSNKELHTDFLDKTLKVTLVVLLVMMIPIEAFKLGEKKALERISEIRTNGCTFSKNGWNDCHSVFLNGELLIQGYLVSKTDENITMFDPLKQELISFKIPKEAKMTRTFKDFKSVINQ